MAKFPTAIRPVPETPPEQARKAALALAAQALAADATPDDLRDVLAATGLLDLAHNATKEASHVG